MVAVCFLTYYFCTSTHPGKTPTSAGTTIWEHGLSGIISGMILHPDPVLRRCRAWLGGYLGVIRSIRSGLVPLLGVPILLLG